MRNYFDDNKFVRATERIDAQDRKWLSELPDEPFTTREAWGVWGVHPKTAMRRLDLLKCSGLIRFVFLNVKGGFGTIRGKWVRL